MTLSDTERLLVTDDEQVVVLKDDGTWRPYRSPYRDRGLDTWRSLTVPTAVVEFFSGLFDRVEVRVIDTAEEFVCIHRGDHIDFAEGTSEKADYSVEIFSYQVDRLASSIVEGELAEIEQFRIVRAILRGRISGARTILQNPLMSSFFLRWYIGGKKILHIHVISPDRDLEDDERFTFLYVDEWIVVPGLFGAPGRTFELTLEDVLELQRRLHAGMQKASWIEWLKLARWYKAWREGVESRPGDENPQGP